MNLLKNNVNNFVRNSQVTVDFDNYRKLGELDDEIFIIGLQSFRDETESLPCILVFKTDTFYSSLKNWHDLQLNDPIKRIIGITRLEKYLPMEEHKRFIDNLPEGEIFRVIDFTFFQK